MEISVSLIRTLWMRGVFTLAMAVVVTVGHAQTDGTQRWAFYGDKGAKMETSPAIGRDGTIYIGVTFARSSPTGQLIALKPDRSVKWGPQAAITAKGIESSPTLSPDGETVYVGCNDGRLYAFNTADGTRKWVFDTGRDSGIFTSPAVAADGTIFIGASNLVFPADSTFYAVSPDGNPIPRWAKSAGGWFESSPVVGADGTVYYGSLDGNFYAVTPDKGEEKWRFALDGEIYASPSIGPDDTIYIGSDAGVFYALTPDKQIKWQFNAYAGGGSAVGADGTVYFGTTDGKVYAIDRDGRVKTNWPFSVGKQILSVPAIRADGSIVFGSDDNIVRALTSDGKQQWASENLGDAIRSSPAVDAAGYIYFASSGGWLYSYYGSGSPVSQLASWPMFNRDLGHRAQAPAPINGGRLLNIATRGSVTSSSSLIAGFVTRGVQSQRFLVRAAGPGLRGFRIANPVPDPAFAIRVTDAYFGFQNDDWEVSEYDTPAELMRLADSVGAFPFARGSKDAAVIATLTTGRYSTIVDSVDRSSGLALVEVYDSERGRGDLNLVNISTRGFVGTGDDVLIAGFVVGGTGPIRVLVRAVGPGLAGFGVPNLLAKPSLSVFSGTDQIASNTGWTSGGLKGDIAGAASVAGAFALAENSADSAVMLKLDPGAYTIQVSGVGGTTGTALVEVYALPY